MNGGNVRVVQAGEDVRLTLEAGEPITIGSERLGQKDLQRDLAVQRGVSGLIDLSHPPFTDEGGDGVMPESGADV